MQLEEDVNILVCCHKNDYYHTGPGFLPIQVGKCDSKIDLGIQGDDTGTNISKFNPNYCELTAHYWYWKNCKHSKYVGLNHYRRYFDFFEENTSKYISCKNISETDIDHYINKLPDFDSLFRKYDIILARPNIYRYNIEIDYCYNHIIDDYKIMEDVLLEKYPSFKDSFESVMRYSNRLSPCNMFIMKQELFEEYSYWLFDILFEIALRIRISAYPNQARVFGYMSERLLNIWVHHRQLRVKYYTILKVSEDACTPKRKQILSGIKSDIIFQLSKLKI